MKRMIKGISAREFHRQMNIISVLLLVCLILVIITSSKYLDKWGEEEIRRSITGEASRYGEVKLTILGASTNETNVTDATVTEGALEGFVRKGKKIILFDPESIKIDMLYKEKKTVEVNVKNAANYLLPIKFITNIGKYLAIKPDAIALPPGKSDTINLVINADRVGTIIGYVAGFGGVAASYLPVVIDISSERAPGNLFVEILKEFKLVPSGSIIVVSTALDGFNNDKLNIVYTIKDFNNNAIMTASQFTNVKDSMKFDKTIELPEDMKNGLYVAAVEIRYSGLVLAKSDVFEVSDAMPSVMEKPKWYQKRYIVSLTIFRVALAGMIILLIWAFILYNREIKRAYVEKPRK
ncbi:MAG: hypothetical protein Q8Q42_04030 [Nanoarchaeota archaeon]|nr:hypothetical protein [Nanoarchaeota archaeon]